MADFRYTYELAMAKVSKKQSLKELEQFSDAVRKISPEISPFSQKDLKRLDRDLRKAKATISDTFSGQQYVQFDEMNKSLKKAGVNLQDVNAKIVAIKKAGNAVTGITGKYQQLSQQMSKTAVIQARMNKFAATFVKLVNFKVSIAAYQFVTQQLREALEYTKELDKTLTEIATVSGFSRDQLEKFAISFNKMAYEMGRTTNEMAQASVIFFRQGKETAEVMHLVEATTIAASIAQTEMAQTSEYLTATLNGFKLEATDAMSVVDKFSAIAANAGTSFEELAIGLTKVASGASNAGIDLDHMSSYIATVSEATRETATNVGTSFKTIIARMRGITSEGHESADSLNRVDKALQGLSISLRDDEGQLRDLQDVIAELGAKWQGLDVNTKSYIATVIAGTRQQNRFIALMDNYDRSLEILETSLNSAGAAQAQFGQYTEGIEYSINQLRASVEELWPTLLSGDAVKFLVKGLTGLVKMLTYVSKNIDHIALVMIVFNKAISKMVMSAHLGATEMSTLSQSLVVHGGHVKRLTTTYRVLAKQRQKMKTDKFAETFLSSSDWERYSTGVSKAAEAYKAISAPIKDMTSQMEIYKISVNEATLAVEEFGRKWSKSSRRGTKADLFAVERKGEFEGQRGLDPKTLKIENQELYNIRLKAMHLNEKDTILYEQQLASARTQVGLKQEALTAQQAMNPLLTSARTEQELMKKAVQEEVAYRKQQEILINKARKQQLLMKSALMLSLVVVSSLSDAIKNADGSIEDTRDRILKLTNSIGSMLLLLGPPIGKAIGAAIMVGSALIQKLWKTNKEKLEEFRNSIKAVSDEIKVLGEMGDAYEELRKKAAAGGISFLSGEEQERLYDYMLRLSELEDIEIVDYSPDGKPIIDMTKSVEELIAARRELLQIDKEGINSASEFKKKWEEASDVEMIQMEHLWESPAGDNIVEELSKQAVQAIKLEKQYELLMEKFTFLLNETAEFKGSFLENFVKYFDTGEIGPELLTNVEEIYNTIQTAFAKKAREGLISKDEANEIINATMGIKIYWISKRN